MAIELGKVKSQHYVPRMFLRNFAIQEGEEYFIWVFDKEKDHIFRANIKNIASENEFYNRVSEEQDTEKGLSVLEGKTAPILQKLIERKNLEVLSEDDKKKISQFVAYQMIRTKEHREELKDTVNQFHKKFDGEMCERLKSEVEDLMQKDSMRNFHNSFLKSAEIYKNIMLNMKWILILNKTGLPLWTSDNPVTLFNSIDNPYRGNLGLTSEGIEIHFSVAPNIYLLICDPVSFKLEPNKKATRDYRSIIREKCLQVNQSTRFLFSPDDKFDFAKTMIKRNPKLKDPDRERVHIN